MTKKDFQAIANIIRETHNVSSAKRNKLAHEFACMLASTNERFDVHRFMGACQKQATDIKVKL